jgi:hypothetical protein
MSDSKIGIKLNIGSKLLDLTVEEAKALHNFLTYTFQTQSSKDNISIDKVTINLGKKNIELTLGEIQELKNIFSQLFLSNTTQRTWNKDNIEDLYKKYREKYSEPYYHQIWCGTYS